MSKQPPPAPTASAVGPYPTIIQTVGRPGTGSLPWTIAPPDHPPQPTEQYPVIRWDIRRCNTYRPVLKFTKEIIPNVPNKCSLSDYLR